MIQLREYQQKAIMQIKEHFMRGCGRIMLVSATGSGKTIIFSQITKLTVQNDKKVLIATDRKELLTQTGNKLSDFEIDFGIIKAGEKTIPKNKAVVCMLETLKIRLKSDNYKEFIQKFDLIIIDEAHKNSFNKLFDSLLPKQRVIGATATPYRTGKMPELSKFYDSIVEVIKIGDLIDKGFLAKPLTYGVLQDLSKIKIKMGEYDDADVQKFYEDKKLYSGVVENYVKKCNNKKTLVFCANISNSILLCEEMQKNSLNAKHLDSTMSDKLRNEILDWFFNTKNAILTNVGILTTGFDCPDVEVVILYRPTKSLPLFLQMVGRGSRTTDTKKDFIILDFGNNIAEHGFWEDDRIWTLKNAKIGKNKKTDGVAPVKNCPECDALIPAQTKKCKICGYIYPDTERERIKVILESLTPSQISRYAESTNIAELEIIREEMNYKIGWVLHKLKTFEQFLEYQNLKNYKNGWAKFNFERYAK